MALVISDRKIRCKGDDKQEFIIPRSILTTVDDWVTKTPDFKLGVEGGHITVADTKAKKIKAENEGK